MDRFTDQNACQKLQLYSDEYYVCQCDVNLYISCAIDYWCCYVRNAVEYIAFFSAGQFRSTQPGHPLMCRGIEY